MLYAIGHVRREGIKMVKKVVALFLMVFVMGIGITACTKGKSSKRLIAHIDPSSCLTETVTVSPDSKQVAYGARVGDKQCVVFDGKEGTLYDSIGKGGSIIFDSADSFHYLALKGKDIYLIEERIK
jgi:hypothetical protein